MAEDDWNTRDPARVALAYSVPAGHSGQWYRSYGNENWEFDAEGLMRLRLASINDARIAEVERCLHWPAGPRPAEHAGLGELGF